MAARIKFAFAHDEQLNVVAAASADKHCKDYTCRGCGKPVHLCYGDINQTRHFRHKPQVWAPGEHCEYRDETYAHRQAKAILQQQRWVKVPAVFPRRADGYQGPIQALRDARVVKAAHVYIECTMYENAACGLDFQRQKQPFVAEPGRVDFVCRPDVMFTDANDKPVLFIEIHVTHEVGHEKLIGLRRAQIDTIEITIPWFFNAREIEKLLASATDTKWLYNHERERTDPIGSDAAGPAPHGGDDTEEAPAFEPESLECQLYEIREALRSLTKFVGGTAVGALHERLAAAYEALAAAEKREADDMAAQLAEAEAELRTEFAGTEAALSAAAAALGAEKADVARLFDSEKAKLAAEQAPVELELRAVLERAAPGLRRRVEERRATYRRGEHAVAAQRSQLHDRLAAAQDAITGRFREARTSLETGAAQQSADFTAAAAMERAIQDRLARLSRYLEGRCCRTGDELARRIRRLESESPDIRRRATELVRLEREWAAAKQLEADLDREEPAVAGAEATLESRRADHARRVAVREREAKLVGTAQRRAEAGLAEEITAATRYLARITPTYEALRIAKDRAIDRRFAKR